MRTVRTQQPRGQKWSTFLRNHAANIWAYDFLLVTDLFFRPLFAVFIIELKSRRVIHVGVTRSPSDAWVAQQLREATPYGQAPKYLIRDNDSNTENAVSCTPIQCDLRALHEEREARMPRSPVDLSGEAAPARAPCLCRLLQPGTTPSRHSAADSRLLWILRFSSSRRNQDGCRSDLSRSAP